MLKMVILLVLAAVIALPIAAGQLLPWWGTLLVLLIEMTFILVAGPRLIAYGVKRYLLKLFQQKAAVLRGAETTIHSITQVADPAPADTPGEQAAPLCHVRLDVTISPKPQQGAMSFYDPAELLLVSFDAVASTDGELAADNSVGMAVQVRQVDEQGQENECVKLTGSQRLRIVFAVPPSLSGRVKLRYYFEQFGDVMMPQREANELE